MKLHTIGFTKTTAQSFFERLKASCVKRVIDVRLNNVSQLAGFAKKEDLKYFLGAIGGIEYTHEPDLAPTKEMLETYKKVTHDWPAYERSFIDLMAKRHIETSLSKDLIADACLLCSEDKPHFCHRRLVAEYLREHWGDIQVFHL